MIISHKHKFVFIKTWKTASTSIEIALASICGEDDIITPISPADEKYRDELGFRNKQNFYVPLSKYSKKDLLRSLIKRRRLMFYNHIGADQISKYLDKHQWDDYFKFSFERNPFDKLISWYYWCGGQDKYGSLADFIKSGQAAKLKGFDLYSHNNEIVVDKVYKYEDIDNALMDISTKLKLEDPIRLPDKKAKGNIRKNQLLNEELFTSAEKSWVERVFAREFAHFDYKFPF